MPKPFSVSFWESGISCDIKVYRRAEAVLTRLFGDNAPFDVVVINDRLLDQSGLDLCRTLLAGNISIPLVFLTPLGTEHLVLEALEAGVRDYFIKDSSQAYLTLLPRLLPQIAQNHDDVQRQQQQQRRLLQLFELVERAKQEWEATVDSLSQLVCLLDRKARVIRVNRVIETWGLAKVREVKERKLHELLHPNCDDPTCYMKISWPGAWQSIIQGQAAEFEVEDITLRRYLHIKLEPLSSEIYRRENNQGDSFALVIIQDITERIMADRALQESIKQTEISYNQAKVYARDLRLYTAQLRAQNEELNAFAHTVAHDLKEPLGPVIGYAEFVRKEYETLTSEDLEPVFQAIVRSGYKMRDIIEALLLMAGIRNKKVEPTPLDMAEIISEVQVRLTNMINEYQPQFYLPDQWPVAHGYAPWVEEIWTNYLSNALKYGGQPPILQLGATPMPDGLIRFWIRDNGPGLTPEEQAKLFTPFTRLSQVRVKGHGLGLSIVHRIVEKLGGRAGVESEGVPGKGSLFYFSLPAR